MVAHSCNRSFVSPRAKLRPVQQVGDKLLRVPMPNSQAPYSRLLTPPMGGSKERGFEIAGAQFHLNGTNTSPLASGPAGMLDSFQSKHSEAAAGDIRWDRMVGRYSYREAPFSGFAIPARPWWVRWSQPKNQTWAKPGGDSEAVAKGELKVKLHNTVNWNWTSKSRVSITEAGMVIEIELGEISQSNVWFTSEGSDVCVHCLSQDLASCESRFYVPPGYSTTGAKVTFNNGLLQIEMPPSKDSFVSKPLNMIIYCDGCGRHFDIVVARKGSESHRCPACGEVHDFDFDSFVNKAVEQSKTMLKRPGGRR